MPYFLLSNTPLQIEDASTGDPASGYTLEAYLAGTTTPTNMFSDNSGTVIGSTVTTNSAGYPQVSGSIVNIWLDLSVSYKLVLKDAANSTVWTVDNISRESAGILNTTDVNLGASLIGQSIQNINSKSDLKSVTLSSTRRIWSDGSFWEPLTGASPGTYSDNSTVGYGTIVIPTGGDGSLAWIRSGYKASILPQWFGAKMDGLTDDTSSLQAAIDYAATLPGRTCVSLSGLECRTTDEIFLYTNVVLKDGNILFDPSANDKFAVNIGWQDGRALVRVAGVVNVEVEVQSGNVRTGLAAFNFGHGARACFIHASRAKMETGPAASNKGHFGFSFYGIRDDLVIASGGVNGAYQNTISQCAVYAADIAYRLDTDGFGEVGFKAQMNANSIKQCSAYACTTSALMVGEGAQENDIDVRADTFISSIGLGTTVTVCEVRGSFNNIVCQEEIGSRGDTQYTVAFNGSNPRYNTVKYSTQQVVTSDVFFNESGSSVGKNVATNICRPINVNGNDVFCVSGYSAVLASATDSVNEIIFDNKCILIKAVARNELTPASYTRLYFAKNASIDTVQRLTWDNTDAVGTIKTLNTDPTAAGTIDSRFIYDAGDRVRVRIDQDSSGAQALGWTLYFKSLHRS